MKNFIKLSLLGVILTAALILGSCNEELIKKGGTIQVTNGFSGINYVIIVEGAGFEDALADLQSGGGTLMNSGATQTFTYSEDGFYTVVALQPLPTGFYQTVYLALGSTEKVTIK